MYTYQQSQLTSLTNVTTGLVAQLNNESDIQAEVGSAYQSMLAGPENVGSLGQQVAADFLNRKVFRDNPQIFQNLTTSNTIVSLQEVIRQMKAAGASILSMTVTATPAAAPAPPGPHFSGIGNGIINLSAIRPLDGLTLENSFAETIKFVCTSDSYVGGATAGNETITITGVGSEGDLFAFDWPLGSNGQISFNSIDGNVNNGSGNILTNSGFNSWGTGATANVPNNWVIALGAANISKESTLVYDGTNALKLTGDAGNTLTSWSQQFGKSTGTAGTLTPLTQYSFNVFLRRDSVAAGAGTLEIALVDQNGAVIKDANGANNLFTINLAALTTNYASSVAAFRTPEILPSSQFLRMRLTTALTNGRSVFIDKASLGQMAQLYTGGPFVAVHSGSIPFSQGGGNIYPDLATATVTNSRGAAGTLSTFQTLMYLLFPDVVNSELLFPSSPTPTVLDSLIN